MPKYLLILLIITPSFTGAQSYSGAVLNPHHFGHTECLNEDQRAGIHAQLRANILLLQAEGILPVHYPEALVLFNWPLRLRTGVNEYGYHSISGQVDHNPGFPNQLQDYNCGTRTYDTPSGYNHKGTDYFLWPFEWNKMDSMDVEIIAAAAGTIIYKSDGNFDRNCGFNNNNWNAVYVQHSDGSVAWYGHMKSGSLTTKTVGQTVAQGEYLGAVGSSGNSTGPHLHFEVYDVNNNLIDPYQGSCNPTTTSSWWNAQRPYIDAAINHIATNSAPPVFNPCPQQDNRNERDYFTNTDTIFLMTYYRFLSLNDSVLITIYRPDNSVWGNWWWGNTWGNFNAAYVYWWAVLGGSEPSGQWKFEAVYGNQTYFHHFYIGLSSAQEENPDFVALYPNPAHDKLTVAASRTGELVLFNALGETAGSWPLHPGENILDISGLAEGIYFYGLGPSGRGKVIIR
ncbi:MAG: peptidoglycan DD-metalloendopeptidase family protein [Bacteroidota bacterium]